MLFWLIYFVTLSLAVAYHHKRHHGGLEKAIEKVVDRELRENTPLKAHFVNADVSQVVADGLVFDLSAIDRQEDASDLWNTRTSDQVHAKTLRIRAHIQGQAPSAPTTTWRDASNLVRIIIFSWLPYTTSTAVSAGAPGNLLDLRDPSSTGVEYLAPHLSQGQAQQFKIYLDETVTLQAASGSPVYNSDLDAILFQVFLFVRWNLLCC